MTKPVVPRAPAPTPVEPELLRMVERTDRQLGRWRDGDTPPLAPAAPATSDR